MLDMVCNRFYCLWLLVSYTPLFIRGYVEKRSGAHISNSAVYKGLNGCLVGGTARESRTYLSHVVTIALSVSSNQDGKREPSYQGHCSM